MPATNQNQQQQLTKSTGGKFAKIRAKIKAVEQKTDTNSKANASLLRIQQQQHERLNNHGDRLFKLDSRIFNLEEDLEQLQKNQRLWRGARFVQGLAVGILGFMAICFLMFKDQI